MHFERITVEDGRVRIINLDQIVELEDFKDFTYNTLERVKEAASEEALETVRYNTSHCRLHNGFIAPSLIDLSSQKAIAERRLISEMDESCMINKLRLKLSNGEELVIANFTIEMFLNCESENAKADIKRYGDFVRGLNGNRKGYCKKV